MSNKSQVDIFIGRATAAIMATVDRVVVSSEDREDIRRVVLDAHELLGNRLNSELRSKAKSGEGV